MQTDNTWPVELRRSGRANLTGKDTKRRPWSPSDVSTPSAEDIQWVTLILGVSICGDRSALGPFGAGAPVT